MNAKAAALFLTAAFLGCASSITTSVDYDRFVDFSRYRTYGWFRSVPIGNDILERRPAAAIDRELAARGLVRSDTLLGLPDEAFRWLEIGFADRFPKMAFVKVHPLLFELRGDPWFTDLVRRIGL
jgi:hypothetical protein